MPLAVKTPSSAPSLPTPGDTLAEIEAMILRLTELRQAEPGKERKADYQAAIDRLHASPTASNATPCRAAPWACHWHQQNHGQQGPHLLPLRPPRPWRTHPSAHCRSGLW